MPGLEIITDAILNKSKEDREAVLKKAEENRQEILGEAKKEAEKIVAQIKKEALRKAQNIENSIKAKAEQDLSRELLNKKSELIKEVIKEAEEHVYSMSDSEYNKLLSSLLSKYAKPIDNGEIVFSKKDEKRISAELKDKIEALKLKLSFNDENIKGGFVLKYGKVEENCSVEAIFHQNREKITDFLNKELFQRKEM